MSYQSGHVPSSRSLIFPSTLTEKLGRHSLKKGAFIFGNRGAYKTTMRFFLTRLFQSNVKQLHKRCKKITQFCNQL